MPFTDEQLLAIKAKYPGVELRRFENAEFEIDWVLRIPGDVEYAGWRAQQGAAGDDYVPINREFVVRAVVAPDSAEVRTKLAASAGLIDALVKYIVKLMGARAEFTVKKL